MYKKIILLSIILLSLIACQLDSQDNINRVNPLPEAAASTAASATPFPWSSLEPLPSITPIPSPSVDLSQFTYKVKINFTAFLPRIQINRGKVEQLPGTYELSGGYHEILIFDLVTGCSFGRRYLIDKDLEMNFHINKECNI